MGDLPPQRVPPARAFVIIGVDFCGPFLVTERIRGRSPMKVYAALFVYFTTKAVHIELVENLSTEHFIASLKCFISRRGRPSHIYCDNATNFVGARNELTAINHSLSSNLNIDNLNRFCVEEQMQWHHIPPRSPHHGGIWEAAVKSAKTHFKRTVGDTKLTISEFRTLLVQIEACLNSRPLHASSDDPNDPAPLTPGHFLIGAPLTALPDPNLLELKVNRLSRWQLIQRMTQSFWSRWSHDYLNTLQQRSKWRRSQPNIEVGSSVIIKEDSLPPQKWLNGRVVEIHTGRDGKAKLKTAHGEFTRTITKLCLLPIGE